MPQHGPGRVFVGLRAECPALFGERAIVLLEEYRVLYDTLRFRLEALDRRMPTGAAGIASALVAAPLLPSIPGMIVLLCLPAATAWLFATTASHARAKEDHLRRIAEIEVEVNRILGSESLCFQSRHPNRGTSVAGRSGRTTLAAAAGLGLSAIGTCVLTFQAVATPAVLSLAAFLVYSGIAAGAVVRTHLKLRRYRYEKSPPTIWTPLT